MYPISFDNPNQPKGPLSGQSTVINQTITRAANRNDTASESAAESATESVIESVAAESSDSLLVVECRRDDRWRVELCTTLSELDGALDMARALRGTPDVDEVCLTLEVSGAHGRESRREVLRFAPEITPRVWAQGHAPAVDAPVSSAPVSDATAAPVDADAMAVLHATLKVPDYCLDDLDFSEFAMPERPTAPAGDESAIDDAVLSTAEQHNRQAARNLLASIYSDESDPFDDENAIHVDVPHSHHPAAHHALQDPDHSDWLDRTNRQYGPHYTPHDAHHHRLEADADGDADGDDNEFDDASVRFDNPLFSQQGGLATKLLVFAGAVALLVLGGAVAELLAVDITTAANAGVGPFDTLSTLKGSLTP